MKILSSFCIAFLMALQVFSQDVTVDQRVTNFFGDAQIKQWQNSSPDSILYYNFLCSGGFDFYKFEFLSTAEKSQIAGTVDLQGQLVLIESRTQKEQFNFLLLDKKFRTYSDEIQIFEVANSDLILRLPSLAYIQSKFEGYKKYHSSSK